MQFIWGGNTREDEISIRVGRQRQETRLGRSSLINHVWQIQGWITEITFAQLKDEMAEVEEMFTTKRDDLKFLDNNGNEIPGYTLQSSDTVTGVLCTQFDFVPGYATGRGNVGSGVDLVRSKGYQATFQAQSIDTEGEDPYGIVMWDESLRQFGGGGPRRRFIESLIGIPDDQQFVLNTKIRVVQQGRCIALKNWAPYGQPVFADPFSDLSRFGQDSPRWSRTPYLFPSNWTYVWEFPQGVPSGQLVTPFS